MAKIFRKLRSKFITEGKVSRYLLYSLGEILLVVIGILIALQVNNANEVAKTNKKEKQFLLAIEKELENNYERISSAQENLLGAMDHQLQLLELLSESRRGELAEEQVSRLINRGLSVPVEMNIQNGVFTELINSGSVKDIRNDSIRLMISSWESRIRPIKQQEEKVRDKMEEILGLILEEGDIGSIVGPYIQNAMNSTVVLEPEDNSAVLRSKKFKNYLMFNLVYSQNLSQIRYPYLQSQVTTLLDIVRQELED